MIWASDVDDASAHCDRLQTSGARCGRCRIPARSISMISSERNKCRAKLIPPPVAESLTRIFDRAAAER
jgi:hypothetical protein